MTVEELHDLLYNNELTKTLRQFVTTYDDNLDLINSIDFSKFSENDPAIRLTFDYAIILEELGYFKKSILHLNNAINLLENSKVFQKENHYEIPYYETIIFHKALALYHLKKYKDSLSVFKDLNKAFPGNDNYLNWIYTIKSRIVHIVYQTSLVILLIFLLLDPILKDNIRIYSNFSKWVLLFFFVFLIASEVIKIYLKKKVKKFNTT